MGTVLRIEPFMLEDEALLGSCGTGKGIVCVTDLRILRVERTIFGRRIRDLSYREISSIVVADRFHWPAIWAGIVFLLIGLGLPRVAPSILPFLDPSRPLRFTAGGTQSMAIAGVALMIVGAALVVLGVCLRRSFVELEGPFLLRDHRQRGYWRFPTPTPSDARVFAGLVRQRVTQVGSADRKKVLPFDAF